MTPLRGTIMTTSLSVSTREMMAEHLTALSGYAKRVVVHGEILASHEESDRAFRMREFMDAGRSLKCTDKELVALLYRGLFEVKRGCDCFNCKSRKGAG